ncbi:MAG: ribose 5-phosphate isomerase B [Candidatus Aureabacteria bacterium]|nr:ribose 5-phosphate isomerase B [Candidatus Auribacterota bacterium]
MKIALASDHGGYELKEFVREKLEEWNYKIEDFGCFGTESVDYPDYGLKAAKAVSEKKAEKGILICTTGIGMSMTANKVRGIRAALCYTPWGAKMSRNHNDANVLVLGAAFLGKKITEEILKVWLNEKFEGGRHEKRVKKIMDIERS